MVEECLPNGDPVVAAIPGMAPTGIGSVHQLGGQLTNAMRWTHQVDQPLSLGFQDQCSDPRNRWGCLLCGLGLPQEAGKRTSKLSDTIWGGSL